MKNLPATKADLEKFATKEELKSVEKRLNTKIDSVEKKLNDKIDGAEKSIRVGVRIDIEERTEDLQKQINLLPTRNEFFTEMDKLMKELTAIREEHTISGYHLKDHEDRISLLEQKTGLATV